MHLDPLEKPPIAKQVSHLIWQHGKERNDPYAWLRNEEDPDVISYLEAENRYTEAVAFHGINQKVYEELRSKIQETDSSVPVLIGSYFYYSRTEEGKQYAIHCRKRAVGNHPREEVILDENQLATAHRYFQLGVFEISPNHEYLAYSTDITGEESHTLYIKDLATGKIFETGIENCGDSFAWAADSRHFFYDQLDDSMRPYQVFRSRVGGHAPQFVFEENDEQFYVSISKSRSDRFIFISTDSNTTSEVHYLEAAAPASSFKLFRGREKQIEYSVDHQGDHFLILHNREAKNFKVSTTSIEDINDENWSDLVPHDDRVMITELHAFRNYLVLGIKQNGLPALRIIENEQSHEMTFSDPIYSVELDWNPDFDSEVIRLEYSSPITPPTIIDYHIKTRKQTIKKIMPIRGGFDPSLYQTERIWAVADDGIKIPISILRRGNPNPEAPLFLTGYGAYGVDSDADFDIRRFCLVDRGFVYAIAHIRGGEELGRDWYEEGKLFKKKNSFTDFIRCAEHLSDSGHCDRKKLTAWGGSAGGLLMGAVMNIAPTLFKSIVAVVPFVDVLNTMSDPTLPLTLTEYEEWGNPTDLNYFEYIASYSPYDNVQDQHDYPHLLVTAGLNDPRVGYWEPAKWVAKQRTLDQPGRILLLKTNTHAGHGGDSGRFDSLKEDAMEYGFVIATIEYLE
jgi:oligopeptidase B